MTTPETTSRLDTAELEQRVKTMYEEVALEPEREFHFETGRSLAEPRATSPRALAQRCGQLLSSSPNRCR